MKTTIDMAREAGFNVKLFKPPVITAQHSNGSWVSVGDELKAFEALVRADEREACAQVVEALEGCAQYFPHVPDLIRARSCPPCNNDCDQGRNCPARSDK